MATFSEFWKGRLELVRKTGESDEEFKARIDEYMHKLGIEGAGPVPESLLSRQDLEGTEKHIRHEGDKWNLYSRKTGKLLGSHDTKEGAERQEEAIEANKAEDSDYEFDEEPRRDGQEGTAKADVPDAEDDLNDIADSSANKHTLAERIKAYQLKRQKTALRARNAEKTFKEHWRSR